MIREDSRIAAVPLAGAMEHWNAYITGSMEHRAGRICRLVSRSMRLA
jgi:hypothetical protein